MLIKAGVDISRLKREIRKALPVVDSVYASFDEEMVVTSTYEGNHGAGSLHYADEAFDTRKSLAFYQRIKMEIKKRLGNDYDVVIEQDHIHIEYDPKK